MTLPRANPTTPFWQETPDPAVADLQSTPDLPADVDVAIVGSGITGASIAWHLLKSSSKRIVMVEARQAASGATGRNGGHTKAASYRSFLDHAARHGTAAAVQIARLELEAIRSVHGLAADKKAPIACDSHPCQTVDVIYDAAQWEHAKRAVAAMREAMPAGDPAAAYGLYERREALARFACADAADQQVQGIVEYAAGSVSAYRFTVGVLKQCLARGLNLQTNTPVVSLRKDGAHWLVKTPRGTVRARDVVLATNAYTAFLVPELQGVVVPLRGQITMHRVGSAMPPALATTYSFIYGRGYDYMITRPAGSACAGDMVIGGGLKYADDAYRTSRDGDVGVSEYGNTDDTTLNPRVSQYLEEAPVRYFGRDRHWGQDHADRRVRSAWTGIMGYTPDTYPLVGALPDPSKSRLWLCCAFQGHGMVYSWPCGRAVASMIEGRDDASLKEWFPACFRVDEERLKMQFGGAKPEAERAKL